jgi:phage gpG-like protein
MLRAEVVNSVKAANKLEAIPKSVMDAVAEVVRMKGTDVLRLAKQKVSGEVLNNRTGTLRRKLNIRHTRSAGLAESTVGIKLAYAAAHEFGLQATGICSVRAHLRRTKDQVAFDRGMGWKKKKSRGLIDVSAHGRTWRIDLPERSFLRTALRELKLEILAALNEAIRKGIKK